MEKINFKTELESYGVDNITSISRLLGISRQQYYNLIKSSNGLNANQQKRFDFFINLVKKHEKDNLGVNKLLQTSITILDNSDIIDKIGKNNLSITQKHYFFNVVKDLFELKDIEKNFDGITRFLSILKLKNLEIYYYMNFMNKYMINMDVDNYISEHEEQQKKMEVLLFKSIMQYKDDCYVLNENEYLDFVKYMENKEKALLSTSDRILNEISSLVEQSKNSTEDAELIQKKIKDMVSSLLSEINGTKSTF